MINIFTVVTADEWAEDPNIKDYEDRYSPQTEDDIFDIISRCYE